MTSTISTAKGRELRRSAFDRATAMRLAATEYTRCAEACEQIGPEQWESDRLHGTGMCERWPGTSSGWRRWPRRSARSHASDDWPPQWAGSTSTR